MGVLLGPRPFEVECPKRRPKLGVFRFLPRLCDSRTCDLELQLLISSYRTGDRCEWMDMSRKDGSVSQHSSKALLDSWVYFIFDPQLLLRPSWRS